MRIMNGNVPHARRLAHTSAALSRTARIRLAWMDYYSSHGRNAALTCWHFSISRQTFYRWKRRYDPERLESLEGRGSRPQRLRQPTWGREFARAARHVREQYPRWGKDKLAVVLRRAGWIVSTSMVGYILQQLTARGHLHPQAGSPAAVYGPQADGVCCGRARQPGPGGHPARTPRARRGAQTFHRPRHRLPLRRAGGPHPGHGHHRCGLP